MSGVITLTVIVNALPVGTNSIELPMSGKMTRSK
jgi:hypothetical protein